MPEAGTGAPDPPERRCRTAPDPDITALGVLIGTWRTEGDIFGEDGATSVGRVDGYDHYEWLGSAFVIHRIDVEMVGERVQGLEVIGPYLGARSFATRVYDAEGGEETSTATVDGDGVWTFRTDGGEARMTLSDDGSLALVDWVRSRDGGAKWRPWMRLTLSRR